MSQNLDRLSVDAMNLLAFAAVQDPMITGFEVRLDDPVKNIFEGGAGFTSHMLTWSPCYVRHAGDPEWAIVQREHITGNPKVGKLIALRYFADEARRLEALNQDTR